MFRTIQWWSDWILRHLYTDIKTEMDGSYDGRKMILWWSKTRRDRDRRDSKNLLTGFHGATLICADDFNVHCAMYVYTQITKKNNDWPHWLVTGNHKNCAVQDYPHWKSDLKQRYMKRFPLEDAQAGYCFGSKSLGPINQPPWPTRSPNWVPFLLLAKLGKPHLVREMVTGVG